MTGREERPGRGRAMLYCVVPTELAPKLHDSLRRHFSDDPSVEVVVERRRAERREWLERRLESTPAGRERRRVGGSDGRRIADRRALQVAVAAPPLPRRARPFARQLVFFERVEPSSQRAEDIDTARVVNRIQAGDAEAFAVLYMRYFDRVYSYLRLAFDDAGDAEDTTQHVFIKVLQALPSYRPSGAPWRVWLFAIARNQAIDELRKRGRVKLVAPDELDRQREDNRVREPDLSALDWISDRELLMFVERLPIAQRQVLMLRFMLDLDGSQIAAVLGRSHEDVRVLQHRALRFLEQRLTALGRDRRDTRVPMCRGRKQYGVLRARRFALC